MSLFTEHPLRTLEDIVAFENEKPFSDRVRARSVHDVFKESAARFPTRVAVSMLWGSAADEAERGLITYPALLDGINRAANLFADIGGENPGVAYLLPNLIETFYTLWGAETAGFAVPINFLLGAEHIADIVRTSSVKILVALGPHPQLNIWEKALAVKAAVPSVTLLQVSLPGGPVGDFTTALREQDGSHLTFGEARKDDQIAAYFHTGGTTGAPKLVAHTHRNQLVAAFGAAVMLEYSETDVLPHGLPMFHVAATISNGLAPHMCGAKLLIMTPAGMRDPGVVKNFWQTTQRHRATILGGVPTSLAALLNVPVDADISSARASFVGAAPTPHAVAQRFEAHTGTRLHEIFGMTEAGGLIAIAPTAVEPVLGSVGFRLPYTQATVHRILAGGAVGEVCPHQEVGLLVVTGPTVTPGYLGDVGDPDAIRPGYLNTGDLAYTDEEGRLFIAGRAKDLIIRSGHNIDPRMIEDALQSHPQVHMAASVASRMFTRVSCRSAMSPSSRMPRSPWRSCDITPRNILRNGRRGPSTSISWMPFR
nr:AMP-binding protein [Variovorax sp. E3]